MRTRFPNLLILIHFPERVPWWLTPLFSVSTAKYFVINVILQKSYFCTILAAFDKPVPCPFLSHPLFSYGHWACMSNYWHWFHLLHLKYPASRDGGYVLWWTWICPLWWGIILCLSPPAPPSRSCGTEDWILCPPPHDVRYFKCSKWNQSFNIRRAVCMHFYP